MTAEPTGHVMWSPNPLRQRLANHFLEDVLNLPEPDVLLLDASVENSNHYVMPTEVVIAVEVVSPGTKRRDRLEKPAEYAAAGIPHFWRIEQDPVRVHAYDLVDGRYELVADSETELVVSAPFEIKLPIREITP
ncbi:Uma2 family endonuclease [Actinoplanes sp. NPDC051513]|uniref:Uma2 family endonuclease n=1 Tax=Actinoplanes sp. NPDC051513 TaxID=3363908 RepID=UPI0037A15AC3